MASRFFGSDLAAIDDLSISMGATVVLEPSTWISGLVAGAMGLSIWARRRLA